MSDSYQFHFIVRMETVPALCMILSNTTSAFSLQGQTSEYILQTLNKQEPYMTF
jgi:hypothetical protein